ncbi:MAG: arginine deiminase-related protein [Arenimonas sp.]
MITRDPQAFFDFARECAPADGRATARAAFLVSPEAFSLAEQSASDNRYMDLGVGVDPARALAQHQALQRAMSETLPTWCFPGRADTPDAVFPNNVFATANRRLVLGHMRHPVRQAEARRVDIRGFFRDLLGYGEIDLGAQPGICELTGSLIIDHQRRVGYCGLSERCDARGAEAMHAAFGLRASLLFDLAQGEYHTNVVLSVLAGRAVVVAPDGFADPSVAEAIAAFYAPHALVLDRARKLAFAANCLALAPDQVWISQAGADALDPDDHERLGRAGFSIMALELDELEKAGGSLRCCVAEVY